MKWFFERFKEDPIMTLIFTLVFFWILVNGLTCIAKDAIRNWNSF